MFQESFGLLEIPLDSLRFLEIPGVLNFDLGTLQNPRIASYHRIYFWFGQRFGAREKMSSIYFFETVSNYDDAYLLETQEKYDAYLF